MGENRSDAIPIHTKLAQIIKDRFPQKETNSLQLEIAPQASEKLRKLVLRDNPSLAEFPFLGLGKNNKVEDIWVVDENLYSERSGLLKNGLLRSQTDKQELEELFRRISTENRLEDLILLGHLHPSGQAVVNGTRYIIAPSDTLLDPSGGFSKKELMGGGDLAFYDSFLKLNPTISPYAAIAANTQDGPQLRAFDMRSLVKIKRYTNIDRVPQITISL